MKEKVKQFLIEIRTASKNCGDDPRPLLQKYDMLFVGRDFNTVYSMEIRHSLQKTYGIEISNEELNSLLPGTCAELGIKAVPMVAANSSEKMLIACYQLTLWE